MSEIKEMSGIIPSLAPYINEAIKASNAMKAIGLNVGDYRGNPKSIAYRGHKSPDEKKPQGRNTLCACGSGKKFKFCCGKNK